jgi:luciferase family oxidoreductase group 1
MLTSSRAVFDLGYLDLCRVAPGAKAADAIWTSVELAPRLEAYGYSRYWLAEHHTDDVAHSCPELLVPVIAGVTSRMRVGTAGILVRFYSPLKVAKDFRLLHTLFPGRIDLGLARGSAPPQVQRAFGINGPPAQEYGDTAGYEGKVRELLGYLRGTGEVIANPAGVAPPEVWILGSKSTSMTLAAQNGTAFCLALFLPDAREAVDTVAIVDRYADEFQPSRERATPRCSLALAGVCSESEDEARRIASEHGRGLTPTAVGTPAQCREIFEQLAVRHGVSEFVFLDLSPTLEGKSRSCGLVAEALGVGVRDLHHQAEAL